MIVNGAYHGAQETRFRARSQADSIIHAASAITGSATASSELPRSSVAQSRWRGSSRSAADTKTPVSTKITARG